MTAVQIVRETARAHGITVAELKSKRRNPNLVRARIDAAQRHQDRTRLVERRNGEVHRPNALVDPAITSIPKPAPGTKSASLKHGGPRGADDALDRRTIR